MNKIFFIATVFIISLCQLQAGSSSYRSPAVEFHYEAVTLSLRYANISNKSIDFKTGKEEYYTKDAMFIKLKADKGHTLTKAAFIATKDKKYDFKTPPFPDKNSSILETNTNEHFYVFTVSYSVIKPKSTTPVKVTKHLLVKKEKKPFGKYFIIEAPEKKSKVPVKKKN